MKKIINNKGITLIALVITIVVLIILAAVAINLSLGNNGIFGRAKTGKELYQNAEEYERLESAKSTNVIDSYVGGERYANLNMISPPKKIFTANLANSRNNNYSGTYKASASNLYTNTITTDGGSYITSAANEGWEIQKSGFYYIETYVAHNISVTKASGAVTSYMTINGSSQYLTRNYMDAVSPLVMVDNGNSTIYLKQGDKIDFIFNPAMSGSWSTAVFDLFAMFE